MLHALRDNSATSTPPHHLFLFLPQVLNFPAFTKYNSNRISLHSNQVRNWPHTSHSTPFRAQLQCSSSYLWNFGFLRFGSRIGIARDRRHDHLQTHHKEESMELSATDLSLVRLWTRRDTSAIAPPANSSSRVSFISFFSIPILLWCFLRSPYGCELLHLFLKSNHSKSIGFRRVWMLKAVLIAILELKWTEISTHLFCRLIYCSWSDFLWPWFFFWWTSTLKRFGRDISITDQN